MGAGKLKESCICNESSLYNDLRNGQSLVEKKEKKY